MLGSKIAVATLAVRDLAVARRFYEDAVGLELAFVHEPNAIAYRTGNSTLFVYESAHAGTNDATAVTWIVGDDMAALVRALRDKGVAFERYDMPGLTRDGDTEISDDADDLLEAVESEVQRRRFGSVVRIEVSSSASRDLLSQLQARLGVTADQVFAALSRQLAFAPATR